MCPPDQPKIYHITHLENLPGVVQRGALLSDARRIAVGLDCNLIGMSEIKQRRLRMDVCCHAGTKVGEYVPFYFCPRSIMLYILYMGNHPDLVYQGGQHQIVHLQADLSAVVQWANGQGVRWAFTNSNAGSFLAEHYNDVEELDKINWEAVGSSDFRDMQIKEGKQAEFLVYKTFPWVLVEKVGVIDVDMAGQVGDVVQNAEHVPSVSIERNWYY